MSILILFGSAGCGLKQSNELDLNTSLVNEEEIADLINFPQYASAYKANVIEHIELLPIQEGYDEKYFQPWKYEKPPFKLEDILWPYRVYTQDKTYAENLLPASEKWFEDVYINSNFQNYGSLNKKAISLYYLNVRNFPTHKPLFKDPSKAGEGFPFDYLQNSGIHANEPLFVSHLSENGEWAYIFTSYVTGWVPVKNISFLSPEVTSLWEKAEQVELIDDFYSIKDLNDDFVFKSRIGMRLPLIRIEKDNYVALAITAGKNHSATYTKVKIPFRISRNSKMKLNPDNLIHVIDIMLQSNYGWGGLYEERDCSSMLRDMYSPFGIWLPRNSSQQAKIGEVISLEGLDLQQKREKIITEAIPFETFLYKKGHILLYLGLYNGNITVLHDVWGVRTMKDGAEGRKVIGKAVISSLTLGDDIKDYDNEKSILEQIISINIITK